MKKENLVARKKLVEKIISHLSIEFPEPKCELQYETPEQLLFATILSAQCTDKRVNMVTPNLFKKYPSSKELAKAKQSDVEKIIQSTGFYRNKAKNLIGAAIAIQKTFLGELPQSIAELTQLAGVGRKTANVVLGDAFNIQEGVVVDTHVRRISNLLALTQSQDPIKIEQDLMEIVPKKNWTNFSHWLILHGRRTCIARRPKCTDCVIQKLCEYGRKEVLK
ncbi:MAG: endonuclease III [Oligoflexia bacterium]|nr:endonuclease III [Oligoflexia bacterium]